MHREDMVWSLVFANSFSQGKSRDTCAVDAANARSSALNAIHWEKINTITIDRTVGPVRVVSVGEPALLTPAVDVVGQKE